MTKKTKIAVALVVMLYLVITFIAWTVDDSNVMSQVHEFGVNMGRLIP